MGVLTRPTSTTQQQYQILNELYAGYLYWGKVLDNRVNTNILLRANIIQSNPNGGGIKQEI